MSISSRRSIAASAIPRNRNSTWPATVSSRVWNGTSDARGIQCPLIDL
jgi:hypothetical protein